VPRQKDARKHEPIYLPREGARKSLGAGDLPVKEGRTVAPVLRKGGMGFRPSWLPGWFPQRDMTLMHDVPLPDAARLLLPERFHRQVQNASMRTALITRS